MLDYTLRGASNEPWFRASEENCFWNISPESKERWIAEKRTGTRVRLPVIGIKDEPMRKKKEKKEGKRHKWERMSEKEKHSVTRMIKRNGGFVLSFHSRNESGSVAEISLHSVLRLKFHRA